MVYGIDLSYKSIYLSRKWWKSVQYKNLENFMKWD